MQLAATQMKQAPAETVSFLTNSWVAGDDERIFFTGQPSLPIAVGGTPRGLVEHRQRELASLRVRDLGLLSVTMCVAEYSPHLVTYLNGKDAKLGHALLMVYRRGFGRDLRL